MNRSDLAASSKNFSIFHTRGNFDGLNFHPNVIKTREQLKFLRGKSKKDDRSGKWNDNEKMIHFIGVCLVRFQQ